MNLLEGFVHELLMLIFKTISDQVHSYHRRDMILSQCSQFIFYQQIKSLEFKQEMFFEWRYFNTPFICSLIHIGHQQWGWPHPKLFVLDTSSNKIFDKLDLSPNLRIILLFPQLLSVFDLHSWLLPHIQLQFTKYGRYLQHKKCALLSQWCPWKLEKDSLEMLHCLVKFAMQIFILQESEWIVSLLEFRQLKKLKNEM